MMKDKKIDRKDFLKYAMGLAAAGIVGRWEKVSKFVEPKPRGKFKEARFYKRAGHLAG